MQSAIVLDGDLKSALAIVRVLGERDVSLHVGATRDSGMALHSRFVCTHFVYPSPLHEPDAFVEVIEREATNLHDMPVILACSDATFLQLYHARERIGRVATILFPSDHAMEMAFDKAATYSLARVSNIPIITTHLPANEDDAMRIAGRLTYPAVIKPRRSVSMHHGTGRFGSATFIHSERELIDAYTRHIEHYGESPLVQECVEGEEYGMETVAQKGVCSSIVVHRRLRSLSPTGGASVLKETVEKGSLYDMLVTYGKRLVQELAWSGPIMVEFKVDSDTKTPKLMEINGRFWGSLTLSVQAGVPFPWYAYELMTEGSITPPFAEAKAGVVTRHFWGDVQHLLRVFFARDQMRSYLYPSRMQALKDFFHREKGTHGDIFSLRDPKPAIMEVLDIWSRKKKK
jgi:predicted ATP-grasp superfamily ATP-dependent carboligase